jgi:ferredoxin-NADP reductase
MISHQVIRNKKLNNKFHILTFKSKTSEFSFVAGQFILLNIKRGINRAYSIASPPQKLPFWKIFVDITPGGPGTTYLKNLKKEDVIKTTPASGRFVLANKSDIYIFAATGCGIAPFIPMMISLLGKKRVHFFWGLRNKKDIVFKNMLSSWAKKYDNFSYEIILSKPPKAWKGKAGHINQFVVSKAKSYANKNTSIYLSGSSDFLIQTQGLLKKDKIPAKRIHLEACY